MQRKGYRNRTILKSAYHPQLSLGAFFSQCHFRTSLIQRHTTPIDNPIYEIQHCISLDPAQRAPGRQ